MRATFLVLAAFLTLTPLTVGQQPSNNSCPTISVDGPSGFIKPGEIAAYTAHIDARGLNITPSYLWKVSAGSIVSGQGTEKIEVRNPTGWTTTVQVEIGGLPLGCPNIDSETVANGEGNLPLARKIAGFTGRLTHANFRGIIEEVARREPSSQLFILLSGTKRNRPRSIRLKKDIIAKQLSFRDGPLGDSRITWVESTKTDDKVVIWLVPPGATPPLP